MSDLGQFSQLGREETAGGCKVSRQSVSKGQRWSDQKVQKEKLAMVDYFQTDHLLVGSETVIRSRSMLNELSMGTVGWQYKGIQNQQHCFFLKYADTHVRKAHVQKSLYCSSRSSQNHQKVCLEEEMMRQSQIIGGGGLDGRREREPVNEVTPFSRV